MSNTISARRPRTPSHIWKWILIFSAWTILVIIFTAQEYIFATTRGRIISFWQVFAAVGANWYSAAILSPLIFFLCRHFRIQGRDWIFHLSLHMVGGVAFSFVQLCLQVSVNRLINPSYQLSFWKQMYFFSTWTFHLDLLTYWGVAGISHAFYIYDEAKQRQLASANLRTQLAQSKLQVLKMQLHPHFIFNTLHAIHALIPDEPEAAQDMIEGLGDLLRASLDKLEAQEVPLRQELAILDAYLGIKRKRFKDRLTLNQKISPLVLDNLVPTLIMQPLVENSIRHGIGIHSKPDEITISATPQDGNFINIEVRNCTGMLNEDTGTLTGKGVGLSNTKARLDALYGDLYSLDLQGCRIYRSPV